MVKEDELLYPDQGLMRYSCVTGTSEKKSLKKVGSVRDHSKTLLRGA